MANFLKRAILLGLVVANPLTGQAQEHEYSLLNSVGRYLGVGYTRGGYHAPFDGRPNLVTSRHPASDYRPGGFHNFQQPAFHSIPVSPQGFAHPAISPAPMTYNASGSNANSLGQSGPGSGPSAQPEVIPTPKPQTPPKPAGPPPTWLKDYLQDEQSKSPTGTNSGPTDNTGPQQPTLDQLPKPESSPSDLLLEETNSDLLPALGVTYSIIEPGTWRTYPHAYPGRTTTVQPTAPNSAGPNRYPSYQVRP